MKRPGRTLPITSAELFGIRSALAAGDPIKQIAVCQGYGDIRTFNTALAVAGYRIVSRVMRTGPGGSQGTRALALSGEQVDDLRRMVESEGRSVWDATQALGFTNTRSATNAMRSAGVGVVRDLAKTRALRMPRATKAKRAAG